MISDQTYISWQNKLHANKKFAQFWTFGGIYITGFFYCGVVLFFAPSLRPMATLGAVAFIFSRFVVSEVIYFFYKRVRPYQRLNFIPPVSKSFISWVNKRRDSFPSGHGASLVAISVVCLFYQPVLGILGLLAAAYNSVSRVILGYHHPSDIVAGWVVGILSSLAIVHWLAPVLFTRVF